MWVKEGAPSLGARLAEQWSDGGGAVVDRAALRASTR
jgi:hypothetical protein